MRNVYKYLIKRGALTIFTVLTGITLVTSAFGVVKVAGNVNSFKPKVPEIKTVQEALREDSDLSKPSPSPLPTSTKTKTETVSLSPTAIPIQPTSITNDHADTTPSVTSAGDNEVKNDSNHDRLEVDDDLEVSREDSQLNLNSEAQIHKNKNSDNQ